MKSFTFIYLLVATMMLTACQAFQFVDSPIPVKPAPTNLVA
jgi:uncharacterized lipoprotein YajG